MVQRTIAIRFINDTKQRRLTAQLGWPVPSYQVATVALFRVDFLGVPIYPHSNNLLTTYSCKNYIPPFFG